MTPHLQRRTGVIRWWPAVFLGCWLSVAPSAHAHIGSPTVFFDGSAGVYPVHVVIRPPPVIPGLAEVSVRVLTNGIERVTALPIRWNTGRKGAPPPDEAVLVRGETNLYSVPLWFMQGGAQSVEIQIAGRAGPGAVIVPVNAVATRVLVMPRSLGWPLLFSGVLLVLLLATIVGAAVREGGLQGGAAPTRKRRWLGRAATLGSALILIVLAWSGNHWWESEAANYRNNRLYRPLEMRASLAAASAPDDLRHLRLDLADQRFQRGAPLVPDHGKLMHLFLIREPGLDHFAHLHPQRLDWKTFETSLPNLPDGSYRVYADVTYETGYADTLTTTLSLPETHAAPPSSSENQEAFDPDDSWRQAPPLVQSTPDLSHLRETIRKGSRAWTVDCLRPAALYANQEITLRFRVSDADGRPAPVEPYLGMAGHLVLRHQDGSVFTHLHPGGSFSMAAQLLFQMRAEGKAPLRAAAATNDPICRLPGLAEIEAAWRDANSPESDRVISFPYAFPKPGWYRLWYQFKAQGEVITSVFDLEVLAGLQKS
jgi:hypothetical protein